MGPYDPCKWDGMYNPYKWPKINGFAWGEKTLLIGVITLFRTSRGPPCGGFKPFQKNKSKWIFSPKSSGLTVEKMLENTNCMSGFALNLPPPKHPPTVCPGFPHLRRGSRIFFRPRGFRDPRVGDRRGEKRREKAA